MSTLSKVFGIGFHKTATSSLAAALYTLGYNVTGYFGVHDPDISQTVYRQAYDLADRFDAAQDTPWPVLYKELDQRYPGSKFILTYRDTDVWLNSVVKHFKRHHIPAHQWIYGVPTAADYEEVYRRRYEEHNQSVVDYFKNRSGDLLVIDLTREDGWKKICPFLDIDVPPFDFPRQNTAEQKRLDIIPRGINFMKRKLVRNYDKTEDSQMKQGVSATFVRDILHFHYQSFDSTWDSVQQLPESTFNQMDPSEGSIRDQLMTQLLEEKQWLHRLSGQNHDKLVLSSNECTKETLYKIWKENQLYMREYVSNLTDATCEDKIPNGNAYVWEVFVHLMNQGTKQRAQLTQQLKSSGVPIQDDDFLGFFRHSN